LIKLNFYLYFIGAFSKEDASGVLLNKPSCAAALEEHVYLLGFFALSGILLDLFVVYKSPEFGILIFCGFIYTIAIKKIIRLKSVCITTFSILWLNALSRAIKKISQEIRNQEI
jgi:hypothetical protein